MLLYVITYQNPGYLIFQHGFPKMWYAITTHAP